MIRNKEILGSVKEQRSRLEILKEMRLDNNEYLIPIIGRTMKCRPGQKYRK